MMCRDFESKYPECENLQSSLRRISIDINQMINTFFALSECAPSPSNTGYIAYLESCLLHVRNLITFFHNLEFEKITSEDCEQEEHSSDVIQAQDFTLVHDVFDQYLVAGNRYWLIDSSSPVDQILRSAVVALAETFENFVKEFPAESAEKLLLEDSTQVVLGKLDFRVRGK